MPYYVYLLTDKPYGTFYIGVTNDLARRIYEHKTECFAGFTKKYGLKTLAYYEVFENIEEAILREKRLKRWKREWKIDLVHAHNRQWLDLYEELNH